MPILVETYPLDPKKPLKKTIERLRYWVGLLVIWIGMIVISARVNPVAFSLISPLVIILIAVVLIAMLALATYIYELFYLKYYFYDIVGSTLIIRKGVFSRNEITVAFNRLQDVYVDQDILDRLFGLYDIHVSSATITSGTLSHIDGLPKDHAKVIKELILKKIGKDD